MTNHGAYAKEISNDLLNMWNEQYYNEESRETLIPMEGTFDFPERNWEITSPLYSRNEYEKECDLRKSPCLSQYEEELHRRVMKNELSDVKRRRNLLGKTGLKEEFQSKYETGKFVDPRSVPEKYRYDGSWEEYSRGEYDNNEEGVGDFPMRYLFTGWKKPRHLFVPDHKLLTL